MNTTSEYVFPASFAQRSFWFLHQMQPDSPFYNVPIALRLAGRLDTSILARVFDIILERHEPLRTVFGIEEGDPVQIVAQTVHPDSRMQLIDLSILPLSEADDRAGDLVAKEVAAPFDLSRGPVIRIRLMRVTPTDHRLLVVIHHIVADVLSCDVLIREFAALYGALHCGKPYDLPPLELQYGDYAIWQRNAFEQDEFKRRMHYWARQLKSPIPVLNLPYDQPRPPIQTSNGASLAVRVPHGLGAAFVEFCKQKHVTFFTVALAAYAVLLHRKTGQTDIAIGAPVMNRSVRQLESVIGLFLNSVVFRVDVKPSESFETLLARVRQTVLDAFDNEIPFEKLVEELRPERDLSRSPFFQTMLTVQNADTTPIILPDVEVSRVTEVAWNTSKFDLTVFFDQAEKGLTVGAEYNTDLFAVTTVETMLNELVSLLGVVIRHPQDAINLLDLQPHASASIKGEPIAELMHRLQALGLRLHMDSGRLKVNAPKGVVDDDLKATIAARRDDIIAALQSVDDDKRHRIDRIPRIARGGILPVSSAQQRFWFLDRMDPGQSHYNVGAAVRLLGALDIDIMRQSFDDVVARHESLRTRINDEDGSPWADIMRSMEAMIEIVDLQKWPDSTCATEAVHVVEQWLRKPFNLQRGPLARFLIIRMAPNSHIVGMGAHHMMVDGWSLAIAWGEICKVYEARAAGRIADFLPPLAIQYVDYAAWEREELRAGALARKLAYWKKQLSGAPSLLDLPTDRPRPAAQSFRGARLIRLFDRSLVDELSACGRGHQATLFMVLLAAWLVVLHRHSGQDDIVIGSPVANRGKPELEGIIGCLVNNVVLRSQLAGNPTFAEFLQQLKQTVLSAFENSTLPFDTLVEALNPDRTASYSPVFQVLFTLLSFPIDFDAPTGLVMEPLDNKISTARFDLALDLTPMSIGEHQGDYVAAYEYATDLFDESTIGRIHGHFERILKAVVADASFRIDDFVLLLPEEEKLLSECNNTGVAHDRTQTVHGLLETIARAAPDATAVTAGEVKLSYRALDQQANQLAHLLISRGVSPGALVAICVDRTVDMPIAMAAVLKSGAAYVPLDPTHPSDRLRYTIENAGISCVIAQSRLAASLAGVNAPSLMLDQLQSELSGLPTTAPDVRAKPDDLAYVIYTSGSTGRPKGVQVEHRNLVSFLDAMRREPGLEAGDLILAITTLSFDIAGLEIWLPLSVGGHVVIASRTDVLDGERLIHLLHSHDVTLFQATPATWRLLLDAGWSGKRNLKALCGGEALPRDLAGALVDRVAELWNMYGPTETTIWSTLCQVVDPAQGIFIGHPIANTKVYVLDPSGRPTPIGVPGELCIGGEGVARGYRNLPELTAEKFVTVRLADGWSERLYRTGDIVRLRANGQLEFLGRRDHQVKVRGYRIELGEIETVLATHDGVKECVVVAREDGPGDQRLVAYVTLSTGASFDDEAARNKLRGKLPEYMIPNHFMVLPALPLTPNGKIDRKALVALQPTPRETVASTDALMNSVQRQIADVWCEVLRLDRIGLHDNFFDLGGHSLLLVKLQTALKRQFQTDITLVELFQRTTVAAQAERFSSPVSSTGAGAVKRAQARAARQFHG